MTNISRTPLFWSLCFSALFMAACSATGDEETINSIHHYQEDDSALSSCSTATSDNPSSPSSSSTAKSDNPSSSSEDASTDQNDDSQFDNEGSVKPIVTCPSNHPILDWSDECHACDDDKGFIADDDESCEKICNGENGTTKRVRKFSYCVLEKCPENKPLMDYWGDCKSCKYDGPVSDTANCSKCSNRKVQNGYCVIASCEGRPLIDDDGFCYPCSTSLSVQTLTGECTSKCPNRRESGSWSYGDGTSKTEGKFCDYDSEGSE